MSSRIIRCPDPAQTACCVRYRWIPLRRNGLDFPANPPWRACGAFAVQAGRHSRTTRCFRREEELPWQKVQPEMATPKMPWCRHLSS